MKLGRPRLFRRATAAARARPEDGRGDNLAADGVSESDAGSTIVKVTMLLSDAAQTAGGKLYVLGGGWSVCPSPTPPMALAIKIDVPWDEANRRHACRIELVDADDQPVMAPMDDGEQPVVIMADFEVGRPAGVRPGTDIDLTLAINIGAGLPLAHAETYVWRVVIDGATDPGWRVVFNTRPAQGG